MASEHIWTRGHKLAAAFHFFGDWRPTLLLGPLKPLFLLNAARVNLVEFRVNRFKCFNARHAGSHSSIKQ